MPVWARSGRELFYMSATKLMGTALRHSRISAPRVLESWRTFHPGDVSPDGQRFLFVEANAENGQPEEVQVVLNWTEELKKK